MNDPYDTPEKWDKEAEDRGFNPDFALSRIHAAQVIGPRPPGPYRKASERCASGKRPYCTCDTCF